MPAVRRSAAPAALVVALAALLAPPPHAGAQHAPHLDADVQAGVRRWDRREAAAVLAPRAALDTRLLHAHLGGSLGLDGGPPRVRELLAGAALRTPAWRGVHAAVVASADRGPFDRGARTAQLAAEGRLAVERGAMGAWLSGGRSRAWAGGATPSAVQAGAGAWARAGGVLLKATITHRTLQGWSLVEGDSAGVAPETCRARQGGAAPGTQLGSGTECMRRLGLADVTGGAEWSGRRVELAVGTGMRLYSRGLPSSDARVWGSASAALWLSPTVALAGALGTVPADPVRQLPSRRVAEAGLRLRAAPRALPTSVAASPTPAPAPALTVGPDRAGVRQLRVRVPGAGRVELMGDCTSWRAVALTAQPDGSWATDLPLAPGGVYHLQLRVDGGAWRPPAGLPTAADGFAGRVGVLVVPPD